MKKNNLFVGFVYIILGLLCLITALVWDTKLDSLLFGFTGAFMAPGAVAVGRYLYWNAPKNQARYSQRLEQQQIELEDERKKQLRNKAGRYAYILGIVVISFSITVFSVLGKLEILTDSIPISLFLTGYLIFQVLIGIFIFRHLEKKY
ncbi:hypothetical protein U6B65_12120 [Oscillospiraceae bacterium MB08-C2-2]|nr:hypothetical protein U6B65_12120 [Oscillospiraceae bacterium MB08-C2-2]